MKRPTMLFRTMLTQASIDLKVSLERDFAYLRSRLEHEGLSFLTITLPTLSDSLESGFESGRFTLPHGFKPCRPSGTLPAFLQGLFKRVFELDGRLLPTPCVESIRWIRQLSRFFKKPKLACSPARERKAISKFKAIEEELHDITETITRDDCVLDSVARILWTTVFPSVDPASILCGHGPGVTSDRRRPNERRRIRQWYQRFEFSFPMSDHAYHNFGWAWDGGSSNGCQGIDVVDVKEEHPVRVVFVPKTLAAPRVIAIEPSCMQFVQQGFSKLMTRTIESHYLTSGSVRFSDQQRNRSLAYSASKDRAHATLDLSDASDRVSLELVQRIFRHCSILPYLEDARSLHADLPDGTNIILRKYASMGSALCFPVEASVFYTLILAAMFHATGKRPSYRNIQLFKKDITVFGDDIVVPTRYADVVSDYLESYGLRVNRRKSFSRSAFRESCGADFYDGHSVLPVYARYDCPDDNSEWTPSHILSWIATSDQFYKIGEWLVAQHIRDVVEEVLSRKLPRSRVERPGLAFHSLIFDTNLRFNPQLCAYSQKRLVYRPSKRKDKIDGDGIACFNKVFERSRNTNISEYSVPSLSEWNLLYSVEQGCHQLVADLVCNRPIDENVGSTDEGLRVESGDACVRWGQNGINPVPTQSSQHFQDLSKSLPRIAPERNDFHNTTKRGVFALKRQWVTIFS